MVSLFKQNLITVNNSLNQISGTKLVYLLAGTGKDDFPRLEKIRKGVGEDILR